MTGPLYAIGRFCSRRHYPVIAVWVDRIIPHVSIEGEEYFAKKDAEARVSAKPA